MHKYLGLIAMCMANMACVPLDQPDTALISGPYLAKHTIAPWLNFNAHAKQPLITRIVLHERKENILNTFSMYDVPDDFSYTISAELFHHQKRLTCITMHNHIVLNRQDSVFITPKTSQMKRVMYQEMAMRINDYAATHARTHHVIKK